jgi:hypothetical protein
LPNLSALSSIPSLLSDPRFGTYLAACNGRDDRALRLYAWNIELSSVFWGPISVLEVVVRNAIHDEMRASRRDDWWNEPSVRLIERERNALVQAEENLARRGIGAPTSGQIVAATSLGLWVGLTDEGIPRDPYCSYETALWQPRIAKAFPYADGVRRKELHRLLDDVRIFRNRLAHHEPIFRASHARIRDNIIRIAGFVHPEAATFIERCHRIDHVLGRKQAAVDWGQNVI